MKVGKFVAALAVLAAAGCSSSKSGSPAAVAAPVESAAAETAATPAPTTAAPPPTTAAPAPTTAAPAPTTAAPPPTTIPMGPDGDAFYAPPSPLPGEAPGDVIWARPMSDPPSGAQGWDVLYRSTSASGEPVAVSGMIIAPSAPGPHPVLTWAHGTTGIGDQCAPSRLDLRFAADEALANGWVYAATDYEGLGTPGVHPYLVGESEGHGVLDIVRAARQLVPDEATKDSPVMIFGHSQGGGAALFAAEQAAGYAPDLNVVGTVAAAPAGELATIAPAIMGSAPAFGLMAAEGFHAAYPQLPLDAVLNADGQKLLDQVATTCIDGAFAIPFDATRDGPKNPMDDPQWKAAIDANTAGHVAPSAPVLIVHGDADTTVPPQLSPITVGRYCKVGATIALKTYPGADHSSVITASRSDVEAFFADRLAGRPATSDCTA